jgi:carbon monoxide dehydrogenase subunit G
MPTLEFTHHVRAPAALLWDYVNDVSNWASEVPGYVSHEELGPDEFLWTIQGEIGVLSRLVQLRVRVTERTEPLTVAFAFEGVNEQVTGSGMFRSVPADHGSAAATASSPRVRDDRGRLGRVLQWLLGRLIGHSSQRRGRPDTHGRCGAEVEPGGARNGVSHSTDFTLELSVAAGGMMAPVVNSLLDPLLEPAAAELAARIAEGVERQVT